MFLASGVSKGYPRSKKSPTPSGILTIHEKKIKKNVVRSQFSLSSGFRQEPLFLETNLNLNKLYFTPATNFTIQKQKKPKFGIRTRTPSTFIKKKESSSVNEVARAHMFEGLHLAEILSTCNGQKEAVGPHRNRQKERCINNISWSLRQCSIYTFSTTVYLLRPS